MDLKEIGCENMDWVEVTLDRVQLGATVNFGPHKKRGISD